MSIRLKSTKFDKQIYDKFSAQYIFLLLTSPWLHSVFNNRCNNWHKVCRPRVRPRYGWQSPQFLSLFITCVRCDNEAPIIEKINCTKLQVWQRGWFDDKACRYGAFVINNIIFNKRSYFNNITSGILFVRKRDKSILCLWSIFAHFPKKVGKTSGFPVTKFFLLPTVTNL